MAPPAQLVQQSLKNGILRLTMNAPNNLNALSKLMMAELHQVFDASALNDDVRIIVLGANGAGFCAGHDLVEMTDARQNTDGGLAFYQELMTSCSALMQRIVNHPNPVVADIRGMALAAGCQLVASCDLAIASEEAQFSTPGVNIGLFCSTPMVALSRNVSQKHAMEMLLTGDMISAKRAEQIGLVTRVIEAAHIDREIDQLATKIASKSSMTIKTGKSAFYTQAEMNLADAYQYASTVMVENMMKNDAREGIAAFVEKRDPKWTDS